MIVVDIETSGLNPVKNGIWQIGALDLENPDNQFIEESRIDEEDIIDINSLKITNKTKEELRNKDMQSQRQLIENFFKWCENIKNKICICQNPQFDVSWMMIKSYKYNIKFPLEFRSFDLHSFASFRYFQIKKEFLFKKDFSPMNLKNILSFVGMLDNRGAHNALEDSKLTAEAFSRLVYGKKLFKEYENFQIPRYLMGGNL